MDSAALTPAELVRDDNGNLVGTASGTPGRLADQPMMQVNAEGYYIHAEPINPNLAWYVVVRLAGRP